MIFLWSVPSFADDVYTRVIDSGVIRCGYIPYPPTMMIDANTGEKSGIFYDYMNEIGKRLSLKVEWVQESGWGTFVNDLQKDRFDMLCSTIWTSAARGRVVNHTIPLYYSAVTAWGRYDEKRFENDLKTLNDDGYTIAVIDGSVSETIAKDEFPKAKLFSLPELSNISDVALNVTMGKADVAFLENYIARQFIKNNPESIKLLDQQKLRLYGNAMYMKKGAHDFRLMINDAINEIAQSQFLDDLLIQYQVPENSYLMPSRPYRENK